MNLRPAWPSLLLVYLLATATLAGCVGTDANPVSDGPEEPQPTLAQTSATGTTSEETHSTDASDGTGQRVFRWTGVIEGEPATLSNLATGFEEMREVGTVEIPAGLAYLLDATMTWTGGGSLDLLVNRGSDRRCADLSPFFRVATGPGLLRCQIVDADGPTNTSTFPVTIGVWRAETDQTYELVVAITTIDDAWALAPPLAADQDVLPFGNPVLVSEDRFAGEPGLHVGDDGEIWYVAPTKPHTSLWRSATGTEFDVVDFGVGIVEGGGDSDVIVVDDRHVYVADLHRSCSSLTYSHDGGETWATNPQACDVVLSVDRPWLTAAGDSDVWLAYSSVPYAATVSRSLDGGASFALHTKTYAPFWAVACTQGNIVRDDTGVMYLGGCHDQGPVVARSLDNGLTFTPHQVAMVGASGGDGQCESCSTFVIVDTDEAGNVYVVWGDASSGDHDVWLAVSNDQALTWSEPIRVNPPGGQHVMPWVSAGAEGHVAITWYGIASDEVPSLAVGGWYAIAAEAFNADTGSPTFTYGLVSDEPVKWDGICLGGTTCGFEERQVLDFFENDIGPDGRIHVAYNDARSATQPGESLLMYAVTTSASGAHPAACGSSCGTTCDPSGFCGVRH